MIYISDTELLYEIERVIPQKQYFSIKELSDILYRNIGWIYLQIQKSNLRATKIDGCLRIRREDILKYILENLNQFYLLLYKHINTKDILSEFTKYPSIFSLDEFIEYNYNYSKSIFNPKDLYKELSKLIETDKRFLCLSESISKKSYFVSKEILIEWLIDLNFRLVKIGLNKVNKEQLMSFIKLKSNCDISNIDIDKIIDYGSIFGFINHSFIKDNYVFPLYNLIYRLPKNILSKVYLNLKFLTIFKSRKKYLSKYLSSLIIYALSNIKNERLTKLLKNRYEILGSNKLTLHQIGKMSGLTRERIRQLEKKSFEIIKIHQAEIITRFLFYIIKRNGSLIFDSNSEESNMLKFILKTIDIPSFTVKKLDLLFIGVEKPENTENLFNIKYKTELMINKLNLYNKLEKEFNLLLSKDDFKIIYDMFYFFKLTSPQRLYIILYSIGKPTHYSELMEKHNILFPNRILNKQNTNSTLTRSEKEGIVWIGIKGYYALKEWGFEKPSKSL